MEHGNSSRNKKKEIVKGMLSAAKGTEPKVCFLVVFYVGVFILGDVWLLLACSISCGRCKANFALDLRSKVCSWHWHTRSSSPRRRNPVALLEMHAVVPQSMTFFFFCVCVCV